MYSPILTFRFVAKDVCRILGYADVSNPARLLSHVPDEWKGFRIIGPRDEGERPVCRQGKAVIIPFRSEVAHD